MEIDDHKKDDDNIPEGGRLNPSQKSNRRRWSGDVNSIN